MAESVNSGLSFRPVLSSAAVQTYVDLVGRPDEAPSDEDGLRQLEALGLVDGATGRLILRDPAPALRRAQRDLQRQMLDLEERADHVRTTLERLRAAYDAGTADASGDDIEVIEGIDSINAAIDEACHRCEGELRCAQPGGGRRADVLEEAIQRDTRLLKRGVRMRTVYQHAARFSTPTRFYVERVEALGAEVRTLDEFSDRLIIVDESVAFLPATTDRQVAVAVRQSAVVGFLADLFDRAWLRAIPFSNRARRSTVREAVDSTRLIIARLVVQGDTDAVCARRAGLSLRNYREHVRQLMTQLGARSRSELGYRIAQMGPLDEARDFHVAE